MISAQDIDQAIFQLSTFHKQYNRNRKGVLTPEEALAFLKESDDIITIESDDYIFFTDHHSFLGSIFSGIDWTAMTVPGQANKINTVEDLMEEAWIEDRVLITSNEQLADVFNKLGITIKQRVSGQG